jgi:Rrf2 family protein
LSFIYEYPYLCRVIFIFMFSKTCEYAVRAVLFIAQKTREGRKTGIKEISQGIGSPEHFIAKILQELSRKGLVFSAKGPNGGFYHDEKSLQYSLADIVRAVDGGKLFTGCALGLKACSETHPCPLHNEFKKVRNDIQLLLERSTVGTFTAELEQSLTFLNR